MENKSTLVGTMRIYTKKAAESYRALEHPEKTMQDAMKETAELFPFI